MAKHIITKDQLQSMIDEGGEKAVRVVGRALVVLFENQTQAEKQVNTTNVDNGIGFTGADGRQGCISAKTFLKNSRLAREGRFKGPLLADWQLERWTRKKANGYSRITKYWKQIDAAAQRKAANGEREDIS